MRGLSAKFRVSLGLVGIIISVIMIASYFDIIPDTVSRLRKDRAILAETIAIYSSALVKKAKPERILGDFELILERNDDLQSIGMRLENGEIYCATDTHEKNWQEMSNRYSSSSQLRVPIWSGKKSWGQLELRFKQTSSDFLWGLWDSSMLRIVLFVGLSCGVTFYFYLGKVLRQLDPSQAIPGRVRTALDTMAEGLLILDRGEQIVLANKAFADMFDKDSMDLMGLKASEFPWKDRKGTAISKADRPWIRALSEGKVQKDDMLRLQLSEDTFKTFKVNCSPVLGEGSNYAGVLISFDDVTLLEEKEVELRKSKDDAEQANQAKSTFLANMSHEIRTPMNAILGFAEILKRGYVKNEEESLKYLNTIHSSGKNLLELINDILDLSKVESGKIEFEKIAFKPYTIIQEVVQMLQPAANEKQVDLSWKATTPVPEEIVSDPVRFRQILFNLTGNAVKFTEQGSVQIHCSYHRKNNTSMFNLAVIDTGIGMTEESIKQVFNPFGQADATVTRRFGGTGLGLSISHKFALAMGGDITVTSEKGKGSTFTVTLPIGETDSSRFLEPHELTTFNQKSESAESSSWKFSGGRVLVIDDGAENRELVKVVLEEAGLTVIEGENGQEGIDKVLESKFDIVLMDVQMPVMDGFTAARLMRQKGVKIPVIALTANAMKGFEQECLANGYSGYASKPIDIDKLMKLLAEYLQAEERAQDPQPATKSFSSPLPPVVSRLAGHPRLKKIIVKFIEKLDSEIDKLIEAAQSRNFSEIAARAHWLKGAAGTIGFDVFTEPAQLLETAAKSSDEEGIDLHLQTIKVLADAIVRPEKENNRTNRSTEAAVDEPVLDLHPEPSSKEMEPIVSRLGSHPKLTNTLLQFIVKLQNEYILIEKAAEDGRLDELGTRIHWLKGAAGTVGYDAFTRPAEELEGLIHQGDVAKIMSRIRKLGLMIEKIVPPK